MFRGLLLVLTAIVIAATSARAETSVADFYRNKSIDVYVGLSAGGVYDLNARLLSRFMGRHIPGNPTLVPRNMTARQAFACKLALPSRPKRWVRLRHVRARHRVQPLARSDRGADRGDKIQLAGQH